MAFAHLPRAEAGNPNASIGLNWIIVHTGTDTVVWHNGGTGGYRTFLGLDVAHKTAVVVLTNSTGEGADDIGLHLLNAGFPLAPKPTPVKQRTAIDLPADALSKFVGMYDLTPKFSLNVTMKDGALYLQPTGQGTLRLWPESPTDFFLKEVDAQLVFERDAGGAVTGVVLHQNGAAKLAKKRP
jgi:CubicO group peptidase (beta-lactamase class C family)